MGSRGYAGRALPCRPELERGACVALLLVACMMLWAHAVFNERMPVDDAGISVAYARSLAEGYGLRVTWDSPPAEGFSNPAWTLLLAVLELCRVDSTDWLRSLGLAFAGLGLLLTSLWGPIGERRSLQLEDALPVVIAACSAPFVHWAQGGLETGLQVFGVGLVGFFALGPTTRARAMGLGLAAALVALTRPEGVLYAAAAAIAWPVQIGMQRRWPDRRELFVVLAAAVPVLAYVAFRKWYFGELVPNTYFAKQHWDFHADQYLLSFWSENRALCEAAACGVALSILGGLSTFLRALSAALVTLAAVYFVREAKGDWMMEWRFLAPIVPLLGAGVAVGITSLRRALASIVRLVRGPDDLGAFSFTVGAALVMLCAWYAVPQQLLRAEIRHHSGYDVSVAKRVGESWALVRRGDRLEHVDQALSSLGMVHPLIAVSDLGGPALCLRSAELIDFAGLSDPAMARAHGNLRLMEDLFEQEGMPTLALSWGPGWYFKTMRTFGSYEEVAPNMFRLRGLSPEQDPRCPDGKSWALRASARELKDRVLADARAGQPVRALARFRCALAYRADGDLPSEEQRVAMAAVARELAVGAEARAPELALRQYSLCAVLSAVDAPRYIVCRRKAEQLRAQLFAK